MYGIDVRDPALMRARSWTWLKIRVFGLFSTESRTYRHFAPPLEEPKYPRGGVR